MIFPFLAQFVKRWLFGDPTGSQTTWTRKRLPSDKTDVEVELEESGDLNALQSKMKDRRKRSKLIYFSEFLAFSIGMSSKDSGVSTLAVYKMAWR